MGALPPIGPRGPKGPYERYVKRALDVACAGAALVLLSPVLGATALLVRARLGGPVIFRQKRPGKNGEIFEMYKFRTMLDPQTRDGRVLTDEERLRCLEDGVEVLTDEERLTKLGRGLRAASLDELPELVNILKGDMSVVGPRPLATIYLPFYTKEEMHRHDVRPGLTGLAQVHGRNAASWEERFAYDLEYVENVTFAGDLRIVCDTLRVVLRREGIGQGADRPESFNDVRQRQWESGEVLREEGLDV